MTTVDQLGAIRAALGKQAPASSDHDLNPEVALPPGRRLRPAAVLVGLMDGVSGLELLLTKRSSHLRNHPGQIAFPGGKMDPGDASPEHTALREAAEEVGLPPDLSTVIGRLSSHETVTGFEVVPIVTHITASFREVAEIGEVAEIFRVPVTHVADMSRYRIEGRRWRGHRRQYYVAPFGPYYIWGATACMLRGLAQRLAS